MEAAVRRDKPIGHVRRIERGGGDAFAVEQDQASGGAGAMREFANARVGNELGLVLLRLRSFGFWTELIGIARRFGEKVDSHFGHDNLHDAFPVSGA